jgi:hypothetical protein
MTLSDDLKLAIPAAVAKNTVGGRIRWRQVLEELDAPASLLKSITNWWHIHHTAAGKSTRAKHSAKNNPKKSAKTSADLKLKKNAII